jgi:hypothetical protein
MDKIHFEKFDERAQRLLKRQWFLMNYKSKAY